MIRLINVCALISLFAFSSLVHADGYPRMKAEECEQSWKIFVAQYGPPGDIAALTPSRTIAGWCRVETRRSLTTKNAFEALEWRAPLMASAIASESLPTSLQITITGINTKHGLGQEFGSGSGRDKTSLTMSITHTPETNEFLIQPLNIEFGDAGKISIALAGRGLDLSSSASIKRGLVGAQVISANVQFNGTAGFGSALIPGLFSKAGQKAAQAIPREAANLQSRAAIEAFVSSGGRSRGRFSLDIQAPGGLSFFQIAGGAKQIENGNSTDEAFRAGMISILKGVTLTARWAPGL